MRDEKEGRKKQARSKNKAKQHSTPKAVTFPKINELPRVGLEPTTLYTCTCTTQHCIPTSAVTARAGFRSRGALMLHKVGMYIPAANST